MRRKIYIIILMLMICTSTVFFVPNPTEADTVPPLTNGIGLDYDFVWENTEACCDVIDVYSEGEIVRGRHMGSKGGNYWCERLEENMSDSNICNLSGVKKIRLKYVDEETNPNPTYDNYSTLIVQNNYSLSIDYDHPIWEYPYQSPMQLSELFVFPSKKIHETHFPTYTWNFNDAQVIDVSKYQDLLSEYWPFGGSLTGYYLNVSYDVLNFGENFGFSNNLFVGNVSYIPIEDEIPDNQIGRVFLIEEGADCQDKLDNITDAQGCVLVNAGTLYNIEDISQYSFSICRAYIGGDNGNLTSIINMLENREILLADNMVNPNTVTFTYNLTEEENLPRFGYYMFMVKNRAPSTINKGYFGQTPEGDGYRQYGDYGVAVAMGIIGWLLNENFSGIAECTGVILYDHTNTHFMWGGASDCLPIFSINNSVGTWIKNHLGILYRPTISGSLEQEYVIETEEEPGVEAYNVVGYKNITKSPNDEIIVISGRPDGMWGETPGDSGISGAIVMGIAKYLNDYDITPKYNLTFLLTTGEENLFRGAKHFIDSHPENENQNKIRKWIGLDQLAFDQVGTNLSIGINRSKYLDLISAIAEETNYYQRNGEKYGLNISSVGGRSEDGTWNKRENVDTFCLVKDNQSRWDLYHRAGMNYEEGDVLKHTDRNDVNLSFELFWNITKYFTVNPNCQLKNVAFTPFDRDNDSDEFFDSIKAEFTIDTILPHDLTRVDVFLEKAIPGGSESYGKIDTVDYIVTSSGLECTYIFALSENDEHGYYALTLNLYNSTGRINQIVYGYNSYDDTDSSDSFYLYPPGLGQTTRYFDLYDFNERWEVHPEGMVDGNPYTFAITENSGTVEKCIRLSQPSGQPPSGEIIKVEIRTMAKSDYPGNILVIRPVFQGFLDGDNHSYLLSSFIGTQWSNYFDITNDNNSPSIWSWQDVNNLDCDVEAYSGNGPFMCSIVEVRVTYIPQ